MIGFNQRLLFGFIFFIYCALIIVNPLPLGSNRAWAWSIEAMVASALLIIMLLSSFKFETLFNFGRLKRIQLELKLIALWLFINLLYLIPIPLGLLSILSPNVASAYSDLGLSYGYLSLDVYASLETLMLSLYYAMLFIIGIILINSRKKVMVVLSLVFFLAIFESIYGMYLVSIGQTGLFVNLVLRLFKKGRFSRKPHSD